MNGRDRIIAIEEHFMDAAFAAHLGPAAADPASDIGRRLYDLFDLRLREMDAAGIDMQVLSHQSPGGQRLGREVAVAACRAVNDSLAAAIARAPDRFAGFAMLPTADPAAAADELQRGVEDLGLRGAMLHGLAEGRFLDLPEFRPIFARAVRLRVPVYLHPALPDPTVTERYYAPYAETHRAMARSGWGFGVETGTQAVRMVLSGIFDELPDLQIILGHLGESIPFQLARIDESFARPGNGDGSIRFAEVFRTNFHVTTSGFFSDAALRCCLDELGPERILFAVDWPYVSNEAGADWIRAHDLAPDTRRRILSGNAIDLLRL